MDAEEELEVLFLAEYRGLVRALAVVADDPESAADAVQDAFVQAHKQVLEVLERAVVVSSVELPYPAIGESPTGSTVVVGAPDQIDAASQRIIDEARAQFELPPNATWPDFGEPVSGSVGVLVVGLAFQSTCAWFDYLVDGIETTNDRQQLTASEGLRQLLEHDATAGTGLRSRILQALREAETGQTATARSELEVNC